MKKVLLTIMVMLFATSNLFAHDIEVVNDDGKTIYYNWINNKTELEVSYQGIHQAECFNEYSGNIVIPKSVDYEGNTYNVTSISDYAFYDCIGLTSVNIPDGVTSIGRSAFGGCRSLTSIHISDIAAWCNIKFNGADSNPLYFAHHLYIDGKEIFYLVIPDGVTSIGSSAFSGCSDLVSVNIPDGVTSIGGAAFSGCSSLASVNIPDGVTSIGSSAFSGCSSLASVNIPDGVTSIGSSAFSGCSDLASVNIPDGVTSIGSSVFSGCSSLTSVNIPNGVTSIGSSAFSGCSDLASVNIPDGVTSVGEYNQEIEGETNVEIIPVSA